MADPEAARDLPTRLHVLPLPQAVKYPPGIIRLLDAHLKTVKNHRRAATVARSRGLGLSEDRKAWEHLPLATRFEWFFIEHEDRGPYKRDWLLDHAGQRVGYIFEAGYLPTFSVTFDEEPAKKLRQLSQRLSKVRKEHPLLYYRIIAPGSRRAGRPKGSKKPQLIRGHSREAHERFAVIVQAKMVEDGWKPRDFFRPGRAQAIFGISEARALFDSISRMPPGSRVRRFKRLVEQFASQK